MKNIEIKVEYEGNLESERVVFSLPKNEWDRLITFVSEAKELQQTNFIQKKRSVNFTMSFTKNAPLDLKWGEIDEDEFASILLKIRPFILNNEALYFFKITKVLRRYLDHHGIRSYLSELNDLFDLIQLQQNLQINFGEGPVMSRDNVMDWLNAFVYHRDELKGQVMERFNFLGQGQKGLPLVSFCLDHMIQSILLLAQFIESIRLIDISKISKLSLPVRYSSN